jgi:5-methylcytosine-specific restriction endonuclease McrA
VPSSDIGEVFERSMDALIEKQEKQKFAATSRPGRPRSSANPRHIPALVKRTVWERDGAQCTFVSEDGHRCPGRAKLEYDHVDPVARGGEATVEGIRLRCRLCRYRHNLQYAASGLMPRWRGESRLSQDRPAVAG